MRWNSRRKKRIRRYRIEQIPYLNRLSMKYSLDKVGLLNSLFESFITRALDVLVTWPPLCACSIGINEYYEEDPLF